MSYVHDFEQPSSLARPELRALIGGKAANLNVMATELHLPVPPGFTITTAACNAYLATGWPGGLDAELREQLRRVEQRVGRRFGDPAEPLLVSVRSGAPVSMPGMMDTILNLGLNDATAAGLGAAAGDPDFAADCHRRFREMYRDVVGQDAPEDPWLQLRGAIEAVFRSWNSPRARAYREHEGIPDDLGTAVTVQAMVFGNRGEDSGTGVLFTRNPATGEALLYGDVMFNAQGEDVVAGTHRTQPIGALDERMPGVAGQLRTYAAALERHYGDLCDIEFTIERGTLWMLQVRVGKRSPQAALRMAVEMAEAPDFPLTRADAVRRVAALLENPPTVAMGDADGASALATGLPASPGVACGEIAITPEGAVAAAEAGRSVILVRAETSPDDVHGMARSAGVLTSTGGIASHAAVVARGWGIPAVVGASAVELRDGGVAIGGVELAVGDVITIDGSSGRIFAGAIDGGRCVVPEAATLLEWARELGIEPDGQGEPALPPASATEPAPNALTREDLVRLLLVKGFVTPEGLTAATGAAADAIAEALDRLVADGLVELGAGSFRLTYDGKTMAHELLAADRERWGGEEVALAALDAFLALDGRMKGLVTAWQLREVDGEQVLNDHADAAYDADVLGSLAALHQDTLAWLAPLIEGLPRLGGYRDRLSRAAATALDGDQRYVASPRVDSYHGVWFELHEDLILLAGRRRADEVAAGRA